jgi:GNAT superfamily N-acetyltransferase
LTYQQQLPVTPPISLAEQLKEIKKRGLKFFGLFLGEKQIGFIAIETADTGLYRFEKLAVLPEHRHRGYGAILVRFALDYVLRHNGQKVEIGIINEHTVLKDWYKASGFRETGTRKFAHLPFTVGLWKGSF